MPHHPGERTYNWTDLTGTQTAGIRVLGVAPSSSRGSQWFVEHTRCGHREILLGTKIRAMRKQVRARIFRICFPKREIT